jgi:hypothetical protein
VYLQIDVVIMDPFISMHMVSESNNTLIDVVVKELGRIANRTNCSIEIVHHTRKPGLGQTALTADDSRGASAIVNGCRSVRVLNSMSVTEAKDFKIDADDRFEYFTVSNGKPNMTTRGKPVWRHLRSQTLPNRGVVEPGDDVQVVTSWRPPSKQGVKPEDEARLRELAATGQYRWDMRSSLWFGNQVADVLGLDVNDKKTIKAHMQAMKRRSVIATELRRHRRGENQEFVIAGPEPAKAAVPAAVAPCDENRAAGSED